MKLKNIFIYGMSGAGKDTIANLLRDDYGFLKIRIAGTIKGFVYETMGFKSLEEFETKKRETSDVRKLHNVFGNEYDEFGLELSGKVASINRLENIINKTSLEFDMLKDADKYPVCVCDARTDDEITTLLEAGYFGIFLTRESQEYKDKNHKTERRLLRTGFFELTAKKYSDNIIVINNNPDMPNFETEAAVIKTDGSVYVLESVINLIMELKSIEDLRNSQK